MAIGAQQTLKLCTNFVFLFSVMEHQRRDWIERVTIVHKTTEIGVSPVERIRRMSTGTLIHPSVTASTLTNMQTRISHNLCLEDDGTSV